MAFSHGKDAVILGGGNNLSTILNSIETPATQDVAESSVFNSTQDRKTYVGGQQDATLSMSGLLNGNATGIQKNVEDFVTGSSEIVVSWYPAGSSIGAIGHGLSAHLTGYNVSSPVGDVVAVQFDGQSNIGRDRIQSLGALASVSSSGSGTADDNAVASTNGGTGYLQRITNSTTRLTAASIQHSNNNSTWDDIVAFSTSVTGAKNGAERVIASTDNIKRYTRFKVSISTTGPPASTAMQVQFGFDRH